MPTPAHPFFRHKLFPDPDSVGVSVVTTSGKLMKADSKIKENARVTEAKEKPKYLGEGICGFRYHAGMNSYLFYDMATGECFDVGTCTRLTQFHDGYLVCAGDSHVISPVKIVSHDGEVIYPDIMTGSEDPGAYSEGKYFNGTNFYDLKGSISVFNQLVRQPLFVKIYSSVFVMPSALFYLNDSVFDSVNKSIHSVYSCTDGSTQITFKQFSFPYSVLAIRPPA